MSQEPLPSLAPPAPLFREIGATEKTYAYRGLTSYSWAVFGLAGLNALALVVLLGGLVMRMVVLNGIQSHSYASADDMMAAANGADDVVRVTGFVLLAARVAALIAGGFWIYNAACNARALGGRGMEVSPGWSVGFYVIPIAAWFKPFQAMEEIEKASRAPLTWKREPTPLLLRVWWTAWLASNICGAALNLAADRMTAVGAVMGVNVALAVVTAIDLTSIVLFLQIVRRIGREQARTRAGLNDVAQVFS